MRERKSEAEIGAVFGTVACSSWMELYWKQEMEQFVKHKWEQHMEQMMGTAAERRWRRGWKRGCSCVCNLY